MGSSEMEGQSQGHAATQAVFRNDLPLRAWTFSLLVSLVNGAAVYFVGSRIMHAGLGVGSVVAAVLSCGLIAFTFGAVREGFRLERELLKARLEAVIGTLAK